MTTTRRLAAILAADLAGYSAAMERDEERTAAAVRALRRDVIEPKLIEHHGRLIKTTGDGFLAEFASPIAALNCALAIQQRPDESGGLRLRIGLNLGDVIIEESGDVLGEGVNIAARLEGLAEPGGILISSKIYSEVEGKVAATFEDRGDQQVKNISKPVRAYAVLTTATATATTRTSPLQNFSKQLSLPDKPSIAVLPFQNMSGDPEQEYFADGIVEDIITALSRFRSLFVIARNSSFTYKGKAVDIKQIGRELGVRYVLEGSVRKAAGRVRITGQLIEAATGAHLWAENFDGALNSIFDLQDRVAARVVNAVAPSMERAEATRSGVKSTDNLDAYDFFLRGRATSRMTLEGARAALMLYRQALALDPSYARAHGSASMCLFNWRSYGWEGNAAQQMSEGKVHAEKAVEFGQSDAEALTPAANFLAFVERDLDHAGDIIDRALSLNPNLADAWRVRGLISVWLGRADQAIGHLEVAQRLCPTGPELFAIYTATGQAYLYAGRPAEAVPWFNKALVLQPNWIGALRNVIVAHATLGHLDDARRMLQRLLHVAPHMTISVSRRALPFRRPEDMEFVLNAYRLAGMAE